METGGQQATCLAVFQAVQHLAHDAETGRHQARRIARVNAFGQNFNFQGATGHAAQAGGEPQLVVIAGATVQANDQTHIAQAGTQGIDVGQQIVGARLFAGLNQAHDSWMGCVLIFKRLDCGNAGVGGITIIGATAAIQLAFFVFGCPRAKVVAPTAELRLFVQVAVHQDGLAGAFRLRACCGDVKVQNRCAAWQANDLQGETRHILCFDP